MTHTIERHITSYETVANTRSGNPVYRVYFTNGESMLTERDAIIPVGNWLPHRGWGIEEVPVTITVKGGRIWHIEGPDALDLYHEKLHAQREKANTAVRETMRDINDERGEVENP